MASSSQAAPSSGKAARQSARQNELTTPTSGLCPSYVQANLIVLPSKYASDFRDLCARNPVPCPLLAESHHRGDFEKLKSHLSAIPDGEKIAAPLDIRTDCPRYNVYQDSRLVHQGLEDIASLWSEDHIAFLIGCSFSFESALSQAGFPPRHTLLHRNVPMYKSNIPLNPSGAFTGGTYVLSMRPYRKCDIERVRSITRRYLPTHGECTAWGWEAVERLGIDIDRPTWGDQPLTMDGKPLGEVMGDEDNVPVFWGCGVTPQEAVMRAGLEGIVMAHSPGHMLILDCRDDGILAVNEP